MQVTQFTEHALQLMLLLAELDGRTTVAEAADRIQASRDNLVKVVHHLARRALLTTTRGKGGGIRLARTADAISLGEIVRECEPGIYRGSIPGQPDPFGVAWHAYAMRSTVHEAHQAFLKSFDEKSLAAVLREHGSAAGRGWSSTAHRMNRTDKALDGERSRIKLAR